MEEYQLSEKAMEQEQCRGEPPDSVELFITDRDYQEDKAIPALPDISGSC